MKLYEGSFFIFLGILIIVGVIGLVSSRYLGDDNPIEELSEEIIEEKTGLSIDLTLDSKEK